MHALTGAYALDALSADERAAFELHLTACDTCTQEVAELRDTTTRLAGAVAAEPPARLRESVLERIREVRQVSPEVTDSVRILPRPTVPRWTLRMMSAAAAVLLVATATLAVWLVRNQQSLDTTQQQAQAVSTILRAGDAQITSQRDAGGARMTMVASRSRDRVLLFADELPPAPSGHDYQAWAIGTHTRSAGLLIPHDGQASLDVNGIGAADQIGITIEPTGGSDQPTTDPIMRMNLS